MRIISAIVVIAISLALGGCFASVINAYSGGQDTTLRGNDILSSNPGSAPVQPDGGGGN